MDRKTQEYAERIVREMEHIKRSLISFLKEVRHPRQQNDEGIAEDGYSNDECVSESSPDTTALQTKPSPVHRRNANKEPKYSFEWWKSRFEFVAFAFAILYAIVTGLQWWDLKQHFQAEQRSWVRIGYKWPPAPADQPFQMVASLSNVGKSTITHLYAHGALEVVDARNEPSLDIENYHSFDFVAPMFPTDNTDWWISPYDQKALKTRGFSQPELNGLNDGTKYLAVFGIVIYRDQFGLHWYRFCSWHSYVIGSQVNAPECTISNRTGDGSKNMPYPDTYSFEKANEDKLPK